MIISFDVEDLIDVDFLFIKVLVVISNTYIFFQNPEGVCENIG